MKNTIILILLLLVSFSGFTQTLAEKEFVVLTFEMSRNKGPHKNTIYTYYWITELEKYKKANEYKEPKIYSLFLNEFYGSEQLESCCSGKVSYPYTMTTGTEFNYPENHKTYLSDLRELVKENRKQIQVINKKWKDNHKEKVTVFATTVKGTICECEYGGDIILKTRDLISFPKGEFKIINNYWDDNKNILLFKDFSTFEYGNTL